MISIKTIANGEHFHVFLLNVLEEDDTSTAMPRAMKNEMLIHPNPKAKYPGIKYHASLFVSEVF